MEVFNDSHKEAIEPPTVVIDGKKYTGRLISIDKFIGYELTLLPIMKETEVTEKHLKSQRDFLTEFLLDVFPLDLPDFPDPPDRDLNFFENLWNILTGRLPKRWKEWNEKKKVWDNQVLEARKGSAVEAILASPHLWEIIGRLFTYQRSRGVEIPTTNSETV